MKLKLRIACLMTAVLLFSGIPVNANSNQRQISIAYGGYQINLNGHAVSLMDANGSEVAPINYDGTIYLPIRAVSQALGYSVSYDSTTNTIILTSSTDGSDETIGTPPELPSDGEQGSAPPSDIPSTGTPPTDMSSTGTPPSGTPPTDMSSMGTPPSGTPPTDTDTSSTTTTTYTESVSKSIAVTFKDIIVTIDGEEITLKDANGNVIEPFIYNGTTYLPIRALAETLGLDVSYDGTTKKVSLSGQMGGQQPQNSTTIDVETSGVYTVDGTTETKSDKTIESTEENVSSILVTNEGNLTISDSTITKTGDSSSEETSNFTGLNATVLAEDGSTISISDSDITTAAKGSNAIFSTGDGSEIIVNGVTIYTTEDSSRGLDATYDGTIIATNVDITTEGAHCAGIATDRGEGTITVSESIVSTSGEGSPAIYSTGNITVSDSALYSSGSEAAVIEGKNSITLDNVDISGEKLNGVMLYQSFSGDAAVGTSTFAMTDGSLSAVVGSLFYITNTTAIINLNNVSLDASSGTLLTAGADRWGNSGSNGGIVTLNADSQDLSGDVIADSVSSGTINLENASTLKGTINADNTAKLITLSLDSTSKWKVTGDSYISILIDSDTNLSNIDDNGYTIYYDATKTENSWLDGETYILQDGGQLIPLD